MLSSVIILQNFLPHELGKDVLMIRLNDYCSFLFGFKMQNSGIILKTFTYIHKQLTKDVLVIWLNYCSVLFQSQSLLQEFINHIKVCKLFILPRNNLEIFHAFLLPANCFQNQLFRKILSGIPSEFQTDWN